MTERLELRGRTALVCLAGSLVVLALSGAARLCLETGLAWRCPVMALLHLPCPSCGSTRAFAALADFRLLDALRFNPLVMLAIPGAPLAFLAAPVLSRYSRVAWPLFIAAVALNWWYLLCFLPR